MIGPYFPFIILPQEFLVLLKTNLPSSPIPKQIIEILNGNKAFTRVLEVSLSEFSEGLNLEKAIKTLGWPSFKERTASLLIYKVVYGHYPTKSHIRLIEDVKNFETRFRDHSVTGSSRLFLLGLYIKLANMELQIAEGDFIKELTFPDEINSLLKISQGRSEKIDWLLIVIYHLNLFLGFEVLSKHLRNHLSFEEIFNLLSNDQREILARNLLAYGASIQEQDFFLYEKI
jgi:hypothetical protein